MTMWRLSPIESKNVDEDLYWYHDSSEKHFNIIRRYCSGSIIIESEDDPVFDIENNGCLDMSDIDYKWSIEVLDNCVSERLSFNVDFSDSEKENIENIWNANRNEGLEDLYWNQTGSVLYFYGRLKLEKIEE